jgi:hypothetical protein
LPARDQAFSDEPLAYTFTRELTTSFFLNPFDGRLGFWTRSDHNLRASYNHTHRVLESDTAQSELLVKQRVVQDVHPLQQEVCINGSAGVKAFEQR